MIAAGGEKIQFIAVAGRGTELCTPCGACRQRIREFALPHTVIAICDPSGSKAEFSLADILPHSFGPDNLG